MDDKFPYLRSGESGESRSELLEARVDRSAEAGSRQYPPLLELGRAVQH